MTSSKHAKFSGAPAKISKKVGGAVSVYGGYIPAVNIELKPGKRIVQAWRAQGWPKGQWSLVSYQLKAAKGGKTLLNFSHLGVPPRHQAQLAKGWRTSYWTPMKKYFAR